MTGDNSSIRGIKTFSHIPNLQTDFFFLQNCTFFMFTFLSDSLSVLNSFKQHRILMKPFFLAGKSVNCFHLILNHVKLKYLSSSDPTHSSLLLSSTQNHTNFTVKHNILKPGLPTTKQFQNNCALLSYYTSNFTHQLI